VPFPSAELATSTSAEKETNSALSAKPDSSVSRVRSRRLFFFLFFSVCKNYVVPTYGWPYIAGCARVQGDEEEDGIDDLENEFNFDARTKQDMHHALAADAMLHYGRASDSNVPHVLHSTPQVPLLTNGQMVSPTRYSHINS